MGGARQRPRGSALWRDEGGPAADARATAARIARSRPARAWSRTLDVHLIDGTYELFRHYYALPSARDRDGREVAAVRGVVTAWLAMINEGARHVGVATDLVIESFRNRLWPGYKTSAGIEPDLLAQFPLLEEALFALGVAI